MSVYLTIFNYPILAFLLFFVFVFFGFKIGDLQSSYAAAQKAEDAFPEHVDTQQILKNLRQHFAELWPKKVIMLQ